jgi:hypothetical protein
VKITIRVFIALILLIGTASANQLVPDDFARGLVLETNVEAAIYEVKLPAEVYKTLVRRDMGDMRVFNANEERVPHTLRKPEHKEIIEARVSLPYYPLYGNNNDVSAGKPELQIADDGAIVSLRELDNGLVTENAHIQNYVIDVSKIAKNINELEFELTGAGDNYVKKFTIEHSGDLNKWRGLINNASLTRLQYGDHQLQTSRVALPQHTNRYLRFKWQDATGGIQLSAVYAILKNTEDREKPVWQSRKGELVDIEQQIYEFDLGGAFPVEQFNIDLPDGNTLIEAELLSRSDTDASWGRRYQGLFYNLLVQGNKIENEVYSLPTLAHRYWQLKIRSDDGMGKNPPRFRFGWSGHSLVFLARGPGPFTLAYGSGKAEPAKRPVAALLNVLDNSPQADFIGKTYPGRSLELSGEAAKDKHFDISWQRSILWIVLAGGVFLLGFMAFRLLRQMSAEE